MMPDRADPLTLAEIVQNGLCIGCGLCRAVAREGAVEMVMTRKGRERPVALEPLTATELAAINAVCPGTRIDGPMRRSPASATETVWGPVERLSIGSAGDPETRLRGSSGGVLTALGQFLVSSGRVAFVLHVAASKSQPMRSKARLSFDAASVLDGAGSRYGPVAPLADFRDVLDRAEPFAVIAKPCDITALRNLSRLDPRVDQQLRYALAFVCGGASELGKSEQVLQRFGLDEGELALFRYRGYGNPGPTRIETKDGRGFELTYREMWEDEAKWMIQPRCKICPDAIGQSADIVASDSWLNGGPAVEDEPLNGIFVRTPRGLDLYEAALAAGVLTIEREAALSEFDVMQSHQVRKRRAVWARLKGRQAAGRPVPLVTGLALEACARLNSVAENLAEARGTRDRARRRDLDEPSPALDA